MLISIYEMIFIGTLKFSDQVCWRHSVINMVVEVAVGYLKVCDDVGSEDEIWQHSVVVHYEEDEVS